MTTPIAALGHVGIRKEGSFASGGAVDSWQPIDSEDLGLNVSNVYGDRVQASAEQVGGIESRRSVNGSLTFGITPSNPSEWWECGVGGSSSPYSESRPLSSMLIQVDKETAAIQTSGDMIASMAFSSAQGEGPSAELKCTVNIEGVDESSVSAGSPTWVSGDVPFLHSEADFKLNGTSNTGVTAFTVNVNNNLADDLYGSGKTRKDIPATKLLVTGSFTKLFEDTTERNAFITAQVRSFQATFTRGANSFDINVAKLRYDTKPTPLGGQSEYIMETFNWTAYVDDSATEDSIVLTVV